MQQANNEIYMIALFGVILVATFIILKTPKKK